MAFKGITFAGQNVTPKNDGGLYNAHYGDGILWGCSMAISGDDLVIQSGEFIMGGRVVQVDGATNVDLSGRTLQTGYIQVIMNADLTQGEGSQWYTTFVESATTTFPALTTDDINNTGTLYQVALAVVQISGGNLTAITSQIGGSFLVARDTINPPTLKLESSLGEHGVLYASPDATNVRLANVSGGTTNSGLDLYDNGTPILFAETNNIIFRPKGRNDITNQVVIDSQGQVRGGHKLILTENNTSTSVAAGYTGLKSETLSAGIWLIEGQTCVRPNQAGVWSLHIGANGNNQDFITGRQALYCSNTTDYWNINVFAIVNATQGQAFNLICYGQYAYTRVNWKYALTQLA